MLSETGIEYLRAAVSREEVTDMNERIWEAYAQRGVVRDDASTWPGDGFQVRVRQLRKTRIFHPFGNEAVKRAIAGVLGDDWHQFDPWRAALISFPVPGPWTMPTKNWHSDLPPRGSPDEPEPTEIDGVRVCVRELTGEPGDVVLMLPWTLHNISMNCADQPRFMVTHTAYASGGGGTEGNSS